MRLQIKWAVGSEGQGKKGKAARAGASVVSPHTAWGRAVSREARRVRIHSSWRQDADKTIGRDG